MVDRVKKGDKVYFTYEDSNQYRLVYSTGAQGGPMPNGMLKFDFYTEFHTAPTGERREVLEGGKLGTSLFEGVTDGIIGVTRTRQVGVIMTTKDARSLANWLLLKADEAEKLQELKKEEK
ncbi:hypothetical protein KAX17_01020 [Candidatus Bipolaricaulota bacterium]|nr:hypothetical protein [Candidatus Bipolaricaulota bacterium]